MRRTPVANRQVQALLSSGERRRLPPARTGNRLTILKFPDSLCPEVEKAVG